jgi:hypothetical protein
MRDRPRGRQGACQKRKTSARTSKVLQERHPAAALCRSSGAPAGRGAHRTPAPPCRDRPAASSGDRRGRPPAPVPAPARPTGRAQLVDAGAGPSGPTRPPEKKKERPGDAASSGRSSQGDRAAQRRGLDDHRPGASSPACRPADRRARQDRWRPPRARPPRPSSSCESGRRRSARPAARARLP